jgi:hypothetical protein
VTACKSTTLQILLLSLIIGAYRVSINTFAVFEYNSAFWRLI